MDLDLQVLERQAEICKALGHPKRLQIIYLLERGETSAGDLAVALNTTPANVSQHLNAMRQAGLVESRREASNVIYWLTTPAIMDACGLVKQILTEQVKREQEIFGKTLKK